jgi:RNA polymerase sigma-70 factor (ECF subfamily)
MKPVAKLDDEELMRAVAATGDETAFQELYARYAVRVEAYIRRLLGQKTAAEDLTQDVFMRLMRYRSSYRPGGTLASWLFQIARNVVSTYRHRSSRKIVPVEAVPETPAIPTVGAHDQSPAAQAEEREAVDIVRQALGEMPEADRMVVQLRLHEDLNFAAISQRLGLTEDGARKRFLAALSRMRSLLAQKGLE